MTTADGHAMQLIISVIALFSFLFPNEAAANEAPPENICIAGETEKDLSGCCSGKGGILGIASDGSVICQNKEASPSCSKDAEAALEGCCSHMGGVNFIDPETGAVVCNNSEYSPTCAVTYNRCAAGEKAAE